MAGRMAANGGFGTDETYMVSNARLFALSYVDDPPLHLWLVGGAARLFGGGFVLAQAIEKWGLHRRLALNVVAFVGANPRRLVLGFFLAATAISISTATPRPSATPKRSRSRPAIPTATACW